jgi:hypothetical protein
LVDESSHYGRCQPSARLYRFPVLEGSGTADRLSPVGGHDLCLVFQPLERGDRRGMGGLRRLHGLLGDPDPVGHLVHVAVSTLGRLARLLGGSGGRCGLVGEVLGDGSQLLGTLAGRLGRLLAADGQALGLIQDGLGMFGGLSSLLQHPPGCRPGLLTPCIRLIDRRR